MKWLVKFAINKPKTIIACILVVTVFFAVMIATNISINVDPMKSFSRKMDVIKYYHMTQKKFTMKDMILIGVENEKGDVFNVKTLRYMEQVIDKFKALKVKKTYKNIITGKKETVYVSSELTPDQIISIINCDDVRVDKVNNTIVIGTLTSNAREKAGLIDPDPDEMKRLPRDDKDLEKLIPFLKNELMGNNLLKGTLFSSDGKACTIMVPVEKRIDNKFEVIRREIFTMVDADKLRERFSGNDFYFPINIYNKKVDGTKIDDAYLKDIAESNKKKIKKFLVKKLYPFKKYNAGFYASLKKDEVNEDYLNKALMMIATDQVYEKPDVNLTYQDCIDDLYKFVIETIDPYSRNNLESKLYNVPNIYDVGYLYKIFNKITEENKPANLKIYIAGMPVAEALLEEFVSNDMSVFMTLCILIIFLILFLTIRTPTGIYLPLVTVTMSIIWLIGGMLMFGIEISSGTMAMPSILIAVGSSYVIHFLVRYYEKVAGKTRDQVKEVLIETADSIDTAIVLSAITTMAAFISNVFMDVIDIQRLGILVTLGFFINLVFTFTFIPAVLALQPPPRGTKESFFERIVMTAVVKGGQNTARHAKAVFWGALAVTSVFFVGMFFLKTESSISFMFLESNPIRQADKFINKNLTGTGQMCIVFRMRDKINLKNKATQDELINRLDAYVAAYKGFTARSADMANAGCVNSFFVDDIEDLKKDPVKNRDLIQGRIATLADILNDNYEYMPENDKTAVKQTKAADIDDINAAADVYGAEEQKNVATPKEAGVENIIGRIKTAQTDADKESARRFIAGARSIVRTDAGKQFQGTFFQLSDFFCTDMTQPATLRKIDKLGDELKKLNTPKAIVDGHAISPVGNIMSITDTLKTVYKVFYHDGNPAYNKIPSAKEDGIPDKSLTDRSLIGVCMNQIRGSREDVFKYLVTDDLKLMQYVVFMRSDKAEFLSDFEKQSHSMFKKIFPDDDPYVEKIVVSGMPAINLFMNQLILSDQIKSIIVTIFIVYLCCLFMFRSFLGALFATVPISFTLIITLGVMGYLGIPINYSTLINASIAVGAGIDFCIHFIERFKIEHNVKQLDFLPAYVSTLKTTGVAIVTATLTMGLGFAVLGFSSFKIIKVSGLLVTLSMILSGTFALTVLPAMIIWIKPAFLKKAKPWGLEEKMDKYIKQLKMKFAPLKN